MIRRRQRQRAHPVGARRSAIVVRAAVAAAIAGLPLAISMPVTAAGAQVAVPPPSSVGIPDEVVAKAQESVGVVTIRKDESTGWIAGPGLVMTSNIVATDVGESASFQAVGSTSVASCYVAKILPKKALSLLRCVSLAGKRLKVETSYPAPGTPVFVVECKKEDGIVTAETEGATVTSNNVEFMGSNHLQLSSWAAGPNSATQPPGILQTDDVSGIPTLNAEGAVVSTLLTAPTEGGQPIGSSPTGVRDAIDEGLRLPTSFSAAAVLTVAKRALIPCAVGLIAGLIWGFRLRNGTTLLKCLGCVALGLVSAVAYTFFAALVVGPHTLVG